MSKLFTINKNILNALSASVVVASMCTTSALAASAVTTAETVGSEYVFTTQLTDNNEIRAKSVVIMYSNDNKLTDISISDVNGNKAENRMIISPDAGFAKVYVWSGLDDIKPVVNEVQTVKLYQEPVKVENALNINGKFYSIGMAADELPTPDEIIPSTTGYPWYVFGTDDYTNFFAASVADGMVVRLLSAGVGFDYCGTKCGDQKGTYNSDYRATVYTDKNDNNIVHAVELYDSSYNKSDTSSENLAGESKMNFHLTNAFRVYHNLTPLKWSDAAAVAARLHSEDMATNNYFSHDSLDGTTMSERMSKQGIQWYRCAENISAGRSTGLGSYNGWVNSSGHRSNMLGACQRLGVGAGYSASSTYGAYFTQDFFSGSELTK